MFRIAVFAILALLSYTAFAQDIVVVEPIPTSKTPAEGETWGERIAVGAVNAYDLRKQVDSLQEEVRRLTGENEALRAQLRATKHPEPTKESRLKFTMVTATDCAACPSKLAVVRSWAEKAGYIFENENHPQMRGGTYPRYRICWGEYCEEFNSPVEQLGEAVADRLRKWGVVFKNVILAPPKAVKAARKRWGQNEGHRTPSVSGMSIEFHLTEHHGVDVTGMTVEQMEAEHLRQHGN